MFFWGGGERLLVFQKGRNTEIALFSRRNAEILYIRWRVFEIGILQGTEILILTDA